MLKAGILTLSASDNCGSLLQAYALQQILSKKYACSVEIIDFRCKGSDKIYSIIPPNPLAEKYRFINAMANYKTLKRQKDSYECFRRTYLNLTNDRYKTIKDLISIDGKYDIIITGSDQVWNMKMQDFDDAYFLGWVKKSRKISYAASLGGHAIYEARNSEEIKNWLYEFEAISVREKVGLEAITDCLENKNVKMVLDPTLLLSSKEWDNFSGDRIINGKYIFYYSWAYNNDYINRLVEYFSAVFGLPVYVINASKWTRYKPSRYNFILCKEMGPTAFLSLMKYAEYALVQSYHGVIFAYQLRKKFWLLDDHTENEMDSRLKQILDILEANKCVLRNRDDIAMLDPKIIVSKSVNDNIEKYRNESFAFLNEVIK